MKIILALCLSRLGATTLDFTEVCGPGASSSGTSQLQLTAKGGQRLQLARGEPIGDVSNASLFELDGGLALNHEAELARTFLKGAASVQLALASLEERISPSTRELSNALGRLVDDQGASPVGCKSRLKLAKKKLTRLIVDVKTTASYLHETQKEVQVVDTQLKQTLVTIKRLDRIKITSFKTCNDKKATDKMMYDKLVTDMREMRTMGKTVRTTSTTTRTSSRVSLLENTSSGNTSSVNTSRANTSSGAAAADPNRTENVQKLFKNAQAASLEMNNCMKKVSLLDRGNTTAGDSEDADDYYGDGSDDASDEADGGGSVAELQSGGQPRQRRQDRMVHTRPGYNQQPEVHTRPGYKQQPQVHTRPGYNQQPQVQPTVQIEDQGSGYNQRPLVHTRPGSGQQPQVQPAVQIEDQGSGYNQRPLVHTRPGSGYPDLSNEPEHCKIERETLEQSWEIAYEEITREVESYQILITDTSCVDSEDGVYQEQFQPLQVKERELSHKVSIAITKVQTLRPQLQSLKVARVELEKRLLIITQECEAVEKTTETLEVTKEVIIKMDECAGLDASAFKLPVWVGEWITVDLREDLSVFDADAKMNQACAATFGAGARAAEVSEIDTRSLSKMPKRNRASVPMMPTCPMCGTKNARVCWDAGAKLNRKKRRTDCDAGTRAIICVTSDRRQRDRPRRQRA